MHGHVRDAQGLAQNHGWNKNRWTSLEKTLPMLTQVRYHRTLRHGYARGWEPVHYIKRILTYYDILRQKA
jgi:membrane-bound lytic murein transglycosylase F